MRLEGVDRLVDQRQRLPGFQLEAPPDARSAVGKGPALRLRDAEVEVELGTGVKVRALKATLSDVINPTAVAAND